MSAQAHIEPSCVFLEAPSIEALARLGETLGGLSEPALRIQALVAGAQDLVRAQGCALFVADDGASEPALVAAQGLSAAQLESVSTQVTAWATLAEGSGRSASQISCAASGTLIAEVVRRSGVAVGWLCFVWRQRGLPASSYREAARVLAVYAGSAAECLHAQYQGKSLARAYAQRCDDFVCVASHELRSPLTALQLQLQLVARRIGRLSPHDEPLAKVAEGVRKAIQKCVQLVTLGDTLLDATRIESGVFHVQPTPCNLTQAVAESIESLSERLAHAGCVVTAALDDDVLLHCDRTRMQQVVANLLGNVVKYAPGSRVALTLRALPDGVVFTVQDSGPGISPTRYEQIFERFERTGNESSTEGWGLGLYIVRQIVEAHGGTINVRSALPTGAIFTVMLPHSSKENHS